MAASMKRTFKNDHVRVVVYIDHDNSTCVTRHGKLQLVPASDSCRIEIRLSRYGIRSKIEINPLSYPLASWRQLLQANPAAYIANPTDDMPLDTRKWEGVWCYDINSDGKEVSMSLSVPCEWLQEPLSAAIELASEHKMMFEDIDPEESDEESDKESDKQSDEDAPEIAPGSREVEAVTITMIEPTTAITGSTTAIAGSTTAIAGSATAIAGFGAATK